MSILSNISHVKPSTWDDSLPPSGSNYILRPLSPYCDEYDEVLNVLQQKRINIRSLKTINRVQHPFAYGCFLLRKKQLQMQCGYGNETPVIIGLKKDKLHVALEYNLDKRRCSLKVGPYDDCDCLIIAKCLRSSYDRIERDSEIYPEYVVYY